MIVLTLFLATIIATILYCLLRSNRKAYHPPEISTPTLGILIQMITCSNVGKVLLDAGKEIGPVAYTGFGPFRMVLLNGVEAVREAYRIPSFRGRIDCMYKEILGAKGMLWSDDSSEKRKLIFRNTRHFALGGKSSEETIHEEMTQLFEYFNGFEGNPFSVKQSFNIPTMNGVFRQFFGTKISHNDPRGKNLIERMMRLAEIPSPLEKLCVFAPALTRWVPGSLSGRNFMEKAISDGIEFCESYIEDHKKSRIKNQPRDLLDALTDEVEAISDPDSSLHASRDPISPMLFDMVSAAVETTAAVLEWIVLYVSHYSRVQEKLQIEIDEVIGTERLPTLTDRPNMPYFQAFLQEMFRLAPIIPVGYHMALEDTIFRGYKIEKGTYVIGNFQGIHLDPDLWEKPEEFKPERFIDDFGKFIKSDNLFTFGSGKRSCVGEITARDQLFLYVSRMLQTYNIVAQTKDVSFDGEVGIAYHCADFKVSMVKRVY